MTEYVGRRITAGISKETVRGTVDGSPEIFWLRLMAQNHMDKVEYLNSSSSMGTIVENNSAEIDKLSGEGGFEAEIDADSIGLLLYSLFGAVDTAIVEAGLAFLHTFDLQETAEKPTLSYWVNEPTQAKVFDFAGLAGLNFNFERGKILDVEVPLMSHDSAASASTPSFATIPLFRPKDFKFYIAADIAGLDGASETPLKSMSLEFNPNLETDDVLGNQRHQNLLSKVFGVDAGISLLHSDDTIKNLFRAGTSKAIRIEMINDSYELDAANAATATATIVDYTSLAGKTVTVNGTVLTEGVNWTAATNNNTTATSLAAAIAALANVGAAAVGAVVTITADTAGTAGNSYTLATNGAAALTISGATFTGGEAALTPYMVFDFAKVYFAEWEESNDRNELKKEEIKLTFANSTDTIAFCQARIQNAIASY